ncbi:MAG: 6-carboxytetrahydropterin synthase QueD [Treponemataceae bacterium]|nr:MAG: 6-carboxytetrahydropterin synthase QueD [Treponemataceae bacterium]
MFRVRVEAEFAAAHFLRDYNGKCENLHGHNYRVCAHFCGQDLDAGGMLIDFSFAKKLLQNAIEKFDHTNLNDVAVFEQNPSAERIAKALFDDMTASLNGAKAARAALCAVDVFETARSRARYEK